jgi:CspA family cold shock protein
VVQTIRKGTASSPPKPAREFFVHHASIEGQGFRTLREGERVEFEVKTGERGSEGGARHPDLLKKGQRLRSA